MNFAKTYYLDQRTIDKKEKKRLPVNLMVVMMIMMGSSSSGSTTAAVAVVAAVGGEGGGGFIVLYSIKEKRLLMPGCREKREECRGWDGEEIQGTMIRS